MFDEHRLGNDGTEATGLSKPDDGNNRVQKKSENVAHLQDRIRLKEATESRALTTGQRLDAPAKRAAPARAAVVL